MDTNLPHSPVQPLFQSWTWDHHHNEQWQQQQQWQFLQNFTAAGRKDLLNLTEELLDMTSLSPKKLLSSPIILDIGWSPFSITHELPTHSLLHDHFWWVTAWANSGSVYMYCIDRSWSAQSEQNSETLGPQRYMHPSVSPCRKEAKKFDLEHLLSVCIHIILVTFLITSSPSSSNHFLNH